MGGTEGCGSILNAEEQQRGSGRRLHPPGGHPEHASHVDAEIAGYARISTGISGTISKTQRAQER